MHRAHQDPVLEPGEAQVEWREEQGIARVGGHGSGDCSHEVAGSAVPAPTRKLYFRTTRFTAPRVSGMTPLSRPEGTPRNTGTLRAAQFEKRAAVHRRVVLMLSDPFMP